MPFNSLEAEGEQLRRAKERKYQDEAMQKYKKNAPSVSLSHSVALSVSVCECGSDRKKNLPQDTLYNKSCFLCNLLHFFLCCCITEKRTEQKSNLKFTFRTFFRTCFSSTHLRAIIKLENNEVPIQIMITNYRLQVLHTYYSFLLNIF